MCSYAMAVECQNTDEKLIKIKGTDIGYAMYNKKTYAQKLEKCDYKFMCLYTGGEWAIENKESKDLNVTGISSCLNSDVYDKNNNAYGNYCWCKITQLDNYKVLSSWNMVKKFEKYKYDPQNSLKTNEYEQARVKKNNITDCVNMCAQECQSNLSQLIKSVSGYYVCADALHKVNDVICVVDNKFIKAKKISIFEDVAQISTDDGDIILVRDTQDEKNLVYVGEYNDVPIYLKWASGKFYAGHKIYSMEECM
jgi:hypothetical protein